MAASKYTANMFDAEELAALREKFNYVDTDIKGRHRLFMDNAGGSLRLKAAEMHLSTPTSWLWNCWHWKIRPAPTLRASSSVQRPALSTPATPPPRS